MDDRTITTNEPGPTVQPSLVLVLSSAQASGIRTASLPADGAVTIGRGADCTIVIDDASLSRQHATLRLPELALVDHGSRNGTWLGGARLTRETQIPVGQPFRLGQVSAVIVQIGAFDRGIRQLDAELARPSSIEAVRQLAEKVAPSMVSVLIEGETGVGKEVLAELIHARSARATGPLVKINCAAVAADLFESQMFGHERGAFTGAVDARAGLFETADGGTLFLDEVADLPIELQAKLLRVIEDRIVTRIGAVDGKRVDVRFVTACNASLTARVDAGRFRSDLYFRLAGVTLHVPPLRERRGEIEELANLFARRVATAAPPVFTPAAIARLRNHPWPGNIRQLRNVVERAIALGDGLEIGVEQLLIDEPPPIATPKELSADRPEDLLAALASCAGNQSRAARLLGISRNTLLARLDEFGLPRPRKKT